MDFDSVYEIARTADFIVSGSYTRVALQFPDKLLKDSERVTHVLYNKLSSIGDGGREKGGRREVRLFVMADTTYGSCCVDEISASHVNADCVIHYGHTCLCSTTILPALFVFGKSAINIGKCTESLVNYAAESKKPTLVLFGLEYAHVIEDIKVSTNGLCGSESELEIKFSNVGSSILCPSQSNDFGGSYLQPGDQKKSNEYSVGGLIWELPEAGKMEDYAIFWIGSDNSAFLSVSLTFNSCQIVRYDAEESRCMGDASPQRRILKRRYYLVEKAKDANIVGILVGTLGVVGYLDMINKLKELISRAGKKAYTFVMGKPTPAKLANFPECDIFVYVSCTETALFDSKEFLAPVITPFEAILAFNRGNEWSGEYLMRFHDLLNPNRFEPKAVPTEARFSFLKGGYVEAYDGPGEEVYVDGVSTLVAATEKALCMCGPHTRTGAELLAARSFRGLEAGGGGPRPFIVGRSGRASRYVGETA